MHVVFIPYGKRSEVELLLRDMEAQKHRLHMWRGKEEKHMWIQGCVRILPLGIVEYVFPREDAALVLATLGFRKFHYDDYLKACPRMILRKILKCNKAPKYEDGKHYMWIKENVNIIPLGIREDSVIMDDDGWEHEAL